ncbi:protein-tyrosine phosphatase-like protein [Chytridium lagenaria]|nr:protein-tyrosine phosphatase-like protein [Chytridium lagenaria]
MMSLRRLVSQNRNRHVDKELRVDLDLTYITPNLIAMGYPARNMEGLYRNHINDVIRFFEARHRDRYYLFNLCSERSYSPTPFNNRVARYPFDDHQAPPFSLIPLLCREIQGWLSKDELNVAVIHCKAGKGRTGLMVCCYLLFSGQCKTAEEAMQLYGSLRTSDGKVRPYECSTWFLILTRGLRYQVRYDIYSILKLSFREVFLTRCCK